jgi:hypothetical protein
MQIVITNIPAEYNGMGGTTQLYTIEDTYVASSGRTLISNGKVSAHLSRDAAGDWTIYGNEKYIVHFKISVAFQQPNGEIDSTVYHWEGDGKPINIKNTTTTISFNSLKKWDETYPFTVDHRPPVRQITITDIPAEYNSIEYNRREGNVYFLKPDNRELYAYSNIVNEIKDGTFGSHMQSNIPGIDLARGKYIVAFKIKWRRGLPEGGMGQFDWDETVYWEGESEPVDIKYESNTISFNSLKKWDRSYPYETEEKDKTQIGWKDKD